MTPSLILPVFYLNAFSMGRSEQHCDGTHDRLWPLMANTTRRCTLNVENAATPYFAPKTKNGDQCIFSGNALG